MATSSYAKSLLGSLTADVKSAFYRYTDYLLDGNLRFGAMDNRARAENLAGRFLESTTAAVAGQEFSVVHGLERVPNAVIPMVNPRVVNSGLVGDLTVSRAADANRVYFISASTSVVFWVYVE